MNQSELSPLEKEIARKIDKTKGKADRPGYLRKLVAKLHLRIEAALARGCEGEKILKAKDKLEQSAQFYAAQFINTSTQMTEGLFRNKFGLRYPTDNGGDGRNQLKKAELIFKQLLSSWRVSCLL